MGKYSSLAADIIKNVGGKENVESLRHCVTRLRFRLIDESIANDEVIKNMDGVVTVMKAMGEYMVVIGEHVADVYDEVCSQLGLDAMQAENKEQKNAKKKSPLEKVLGTIMGGMGPTLHLLCACGIIKGLLVLLTFVGIKPTDGIYMLMNTAGDCFFYFLPLILGFNFAKKFQIDPFFGLILAAAMCYPAIQNVDINLWGYVVNTTYTSTFLPILFGLLAAVPLYKWFDKVLPKMIKGFMTPMLTLIIIFPLTFIVIGPLANMIGAGLNVVLTSICEFSPLLAGLILADFCIVRYPWCSYNFCVYGSARRKSKPAAGIFLRCILCYMRSSALNHLKDKRCKTQRSGTAVLYFCNLRSDRAGNLRCDTSS